MYEQNYTLFRFKMSSGGLFCILLSIKLICYHQPHFTTWHTWWYQQLNIKLVCAIVYVFGVKTELDHMNNVGPSKAMLSKVFLDFFPHITILHTVESRSQILHVTIFWSNIWWTNGAGIALWHYFCLMTAFICLLGSICIYPLMHNFNDRFLSRNWCWLWDYI